MRRIAWAAWALAAANAFAGEDAARWYVHVDNDIALFTDRWYTSGVRLARVAPRVGYDLEMGIVQEIYTPEQASFRLGTVDRRPAARLLLAAARHDRRERLFQTVELGLGVTGPAALGEEATHAIHQLIPGRQVAWDEQGRNRLDAQLVAARSHVGSPLTLHYGAVLGTQVGFVHGGFELRTSAEGAVSPALRFAATPPPAARRGPRWSYFVGASARRVFRNELLEGRGYDPFAPAPDRSDWIGRAAIGVAWVGECCTATFAAVQDSREFATQRSEQRFGSLTVHVEF